MKAEFDVRILQTEQNAARSLSDLDDAWQRDKLEWGPAAQSQWPAERRALEEKIQSLEAEIAKLKEEHSAQAAAAPTTETVKALEVQLLETQQSATILQERAARTEGMLSDSVQSLDQQISVLYELVQQAITPPTGEDAQLVQP